MSMSTQNTGPPSHTQMTLRKALRRSLLLMWGSFMSHSVRPNMPALIDCLQVSEGHTSVINGLKDSASVRDRE